MTVGRPGRAADDLDAIDAEVAALIDERRDRGQGGARPEPDDLLTDVYVRY